MTSPKFRAFTLVELLASIAIIAVLATIVTFFTASYINFAKKNANATTLETLNTALQSYKTLGGLKAAHSLQNITSSAKISNVISALKNGFTVGTTRRTFINKGVTIDTNQLFISGSGKTFCFAQIGTDPATLATTGAPVTVMPEIVMNISSATYAQLTWPNTYVCPIDVDTATGNFASYMTSAGPLYITTMNGYSTISSFNTLPATANTNVGGGWVNFTVTTDPSAKYIFHDRNSYIVVYDSSFNQVNLITLTYGPYGGPKNCYGGGYIYVKGQSGHKISRYNALTGALTYIDPTALPAIGATFFYNNYVYVISTPGNTLYKIDPTSGLVVNSFPLSAVPGCFDGGTVFSGNYICIADNSWSANFYIYNLSTGAYLGKFTCTNLGNMRAGYAIYNGYIYWSNSGSGIQIVRYKIPFQLP